MKRLTFIKGLIVVLAISVFAVPAYCENTGIGNEFPNIMRGVRPLGMGNAFTAMPGTDFNAQFYNPAAINDYEKKRHYLFLNPQGDFDTGIFSLVSDVLDLADDLDTSATDSGDINVFNTFFNANAGEFHRVATNMPLFHIRHKYYAAGLIMDSQSTFSLRNRAFPNLEMKTENIAGVVGGSAYGFFDEALQVGGNLKFLYQVGLESQVTTNDILNNDLADILGWSQWDKGFGVGVDLGAKYQLPWLKEMLNPTVSLVIQDVVGTYFTGGAPKLPMSVTAGGGIFHEWKEFKFKLLTDFRELNHREDILKKFHVGVEVESPKIIRSTFAVRAGCNQGYPAAGLSMNFPIVGVHFAFYGEEMGEFTHSKANYRLMGQLTFGF